MSQKGRRDGKYSRSTSDDVAVGGSGTGRATRTEGEGETVDIPEGMKGFSPGQVLGERYQILEMLGRGGMGEVWHAFDLKLRVEVALKALRPEFFKSERRLELLRQEVRAAREVVSPNVCRIFDLIEVEGRELVSMEYVDGATLLGVLQERGPLELKEAQDIASQFLAGLEAIHQAGLIHRDIKPENIMLTRAGRVVVMDFGLARQETEGGGTVSGTPAYMSPEQAAGQTLDARADVYAAGVVLAEMVSPEGIKSFDSRQSVWEGVRSEPAKVPDTPWAQVIQKAVKKDREGRFNSAHTLTRALEDVTLRVEGAEDLHPYPGLASFTEEDAEYFFGREAEVEQMWRKLDGPPRLFAIMGPSGAGKTSFIRAGLVPHAPPGWGIIRSTPGNTAISSLAGVVARETAGDPDVVELLPRFDHPDIAVRVLAAWAHRSSHSLLVVDQFEELFTQNAPEEQRRFADLLRRFVLESDVHVLLGMRDDFAASCNAFESLRPIFHEMTVLDPPAGAAIRRALTQPALQCGYRFEDDDLVDEMLAEVEGERGALPLLAFAAARLWEKRDRETGLLTRQAYHDIGGVGGALARHAEATVDQIGHEHLPIVRELFRNLVTAEGTRAVREWNELLSIFSDSRSESPAAVLRALIDARLLTSYEIHEDEGEPTRRVEIIHESLLANWPRLVRWQTQDEEGAQLRDELRQSARTWDEHGRHDDRLWTGTAFREYQLWRERYPGGLTATEESFASAMTSFAGRRRRRRRIVVGAVITVLVAGLAVVGSFWQRSVRETRRAEAANLVSLGQLEIESYPSATVAHAIASLELADNSSARNLALDALWKGPTALVATQDYTLVTQFSSDGRWLVQTGRRPDRAEASLSIVHSDGAREFLENAHGEISQVNISTITDTGHFASFTFGTDSAEKVVLWSAEEKQPLAQLQLTGSQGLWEAVVSSDRRRAVILINEDERFNVDTLGFDGTHERLGTLGFEIRRDEAGLWSANSCLDPRTGEWLGVVSQNQVFLVDVDDMELGPPRLVGQHPGAIVGFACDPLGRFFATAGGDGEIRLWSLTELSPPAVLQGPSEMHLLRITPDGSLIEAIIREKGEWVVWVWTLSEDSPRFLRRFNLGETGWGDFRWDTVGRRVVRWGPDLKIRIWSMDGPIEAEPIVLNRGDIGQMNSASISPKGDWLATADVTGLTVWPLARRAPVVIRGHDQVVFGLAFEADGRWLASSSPGGPVRLWPLEGDPPAPERILEDVPPNVLGMAASPDGKRILVGSGNSGASFVFPNGDPPLPLDGFQGQVWGAAFSPDGRLAAAAGGMFDPEERVIRIWDVTSGQEVTVLEVGEQPFAYDLHFTPDGHLLSACMSGLLRWDVKTGERELLFEGKIKRFAASADGHRVLMVEGRAGSGDSFGRVVLLALDSGAVTYLDRYGDEVQAVALGPNGAVAVTGDKDGEIRVGPVTGEEPHLLLGHESTVFSLAVDPLGRWIASGGQDTTVRLWPMPDLSKPPLHTLPREELIAKLKTLTNLRVVRDEGSSTGWKLEVGPFPGWAEVPEW